MTSEHLALRSLTISKLACIRGQRLLFRELSFTVSAGQALAIAGPNGIGKTSLLRIIAGFVAPSAGKIVLETGEGISDPEERGRHVGWLGHQDGAKPQLTPSEVLTFYCGLYGSSGDVSTALATAGLERCSDLPCQYLSAGQKKRLALARLALVHRPLWLLDEPLAALDSGGKTYAADLIASHCAKGGIVLAATHEPIGIDSLHLTLGVA